MSVERRLLSGLSACVLLVAGEVAANPADLFGFGARGPARGNAMVAEPDALASPIYNAAAGALAKKLELGAGYSYAAFDLYIDDRDAGLMDAHGSWGALAAPFGIGEARFAFAMALYMPDQFVLRLYSPPATEQRLVLWDNQPHRIVLGAALSARFAELVAIGAGVAALGNAEGNVSFDLGSRPGRTVSDASIDTELPTRVAPVAGVLVSPGEKLRFGLRYTEELALDVKLDARARTAVEGTTLQGTTLVRTIGVDYFTPRALAAGASSDVSDFTFSLELCWKQWSEISRVSYDVELDVDLGIDTPVRAFRAPDPGFRDVWEPRVGVDYRLSAGDDRLLTLRAGYTYSPSPVPDQTGVTNYGDSNRHVATAGTGFRFDELGIPLTAELALQLHLLERRELRKRDLVQPGGDFVVGGQVYAASLGLRTEL